MNSVGKRVVVYTMMWVLLVMALSQVYDNVTGKGMPAKSTTTEAGAAPTVTPDELVSKLAELQTCVAANPQDLQCTLDLASLYYVIQQWPNAQVNYERAVKLDQH